MKRKQGFTLVELLVVVAIITILASIVVPNVADWIGRARMAKAISEVKSADLALTKMLADSQKSNFGQFFAGKLVFPSLDEAERFYTDAMYQLLRRGRDANVAGLRDDVRKKLGQTYMDIGKDPWGNLYHFFFGPLKSAPDPWNWSRVDPDPLTPGDVTDDIAYPMPFRIYSVDLAVPGGSIADGNTIAATDGPIGYPAPDKLPIYIYSAGADLVAAQAVYTGAIKTMSVGGITLRYHDYAGAGAYSTDLPDTENAGGGDDINNWDNAQSWDQFY